VIVAGLEAMQCTKAKTATFATRDLQGPREAKRNTSLTFD
jgi:hypothetical protein